MDITQQDFDYFIRAYEAFKKAGPEGHFPCGAGHMSGIHYQQDGTIRRCVIARCITDLGSALATGMHHEKFKQAWKLMFDEGVTYTNERGYETVCDCFDQLIGHYAPRFMPSHAPVAEVEPVMGLA